MSCYYQNKYSFCDRTSESAKIMKRFPDRLPIICEKLYKSADTPDINKKKYLVPTNITVGQFIYVIRKTLSLHPEKGLFLFINGTIPPVSTTIDIIYDQHKDTDGFLYINYSCENTFG